MGLNKKPAVGDRDENGESGVTQLNMDITENLKSIPEGSLSPREKRRLRETLEREHAASSNRQRSIFGYLRGLWRGRG